jgi:predicted transcriptional regulator
MAHFGQLNENVEVAFVGAAIANSSSTDSNSTRLDMQGFDGVLFVTTITDSTATGVATLKAEQNTADSDTGMTLITGASAAATCSTNDDLNGKILIVDVRAPRQRYVQGVRTSATANIAFGEIIAIRYGPRLAPLALSSTTAASAEVVSGA